MLVVISCDARQVSAQFPRLISELARRHPGNDELQLSLATSIGPQVLKIGQRIDAFDPIWRQLQSDLEGEGEE